MIVKNQLKGESGVAVQVGFILILGILILASAQYQSQVVPEQEEAAEIDHSREIDQQMSQLRGDIITTSENGDVKSTVLDTSPEYGSTGNGIIPAVHPPEPVSEVETISPDSKLRVRNVENQLRASNYWNGEGSACEEPTPQCYQNNFISVSTDYERYRDNPEIVYENGILYDYYPDEDRYVVDSGQNLINGRTITLTTVTGDVNTQRPGELSVEVSPVSAPSQSITVTNSQSDTPATLDIPTKLPLSKWQELLGDEEFVQSLSMTDGANPNDDINVLQVELQRGETYTLKLSRVHVATEQSPDRSPTSEPAYLAWRQSDNIAVKEGSQQPIYAEVRDKYNNGVSGVQVEATAKFGNGECAGTFVSADSSDGCDSSTRQPGKRVSDEEGGTEFIYRAPNVEQDRNITIEVGVSDDSVIVGNRNSGSPSVELLSGSDEPSNYDVSLASQDGDIPSQLEDTQEITQNSGLNEFVDTRLADRRQNTGRILGGEEIRVIQLGTPETRVLANNTVPVRVVIDNTGEQTISGVPVVPGVNQDGEFVETSVSQATTTLEPDQEKEYEFEFTFRRPGNYTLQLGSATSNLSVNGETNAHITALVQDTSPDDSGKIPPTYFRDSVSPEDEYRETQQIPPQEDGAGNIQDFSNLFSSDRFASVTGDKIRVGMQFQGVPSVEKYRLDMQYEYVSNDVSSLKATLVRPNGVEIDPQTEYFISNSSTNSTTLSYRLSPEETEYLSRGNDMYILLQNQDSEPSDTSLRVYSAYISSGKEATTQLESNVTVRQLSVSDSTIVTGEETVITIQYENDGDKYKEFLSDLRYRTPSGEQKSIAYRTTTSNPQLQSRVTYVFSTDEPGTYTFQSVRGGNTESITVVEP